MGNRANVLVKESEIDGGVYLYTHWAGSDIPADLQKALAKKIRWNDCQYLTRIIFDTITEGEQGNETGYGISAFCGDGSGRVLVVNVDAETVSFKGKSWSFDEYVSLSQRDISEVWNIDLN